MSRRRTVRALTLLLIASMLGAGAPAAPQSAPDAIASVRAFAQQYQREAPSLVALEEYVQDATDRRGIVEHQVTTAELVMVRLQGAAGWITFRDVLTVNKRPVRDREERLLKLLQSPEAKCADASAQDRTGERAIQSWPHHADDECARHGARVSPARARRAHPV